MLKTFSEVLCCSTEKLYLGTEELQTTRWVSLRDNLDSLYLSHLVQDKKRKDDKTWITEAGTVRKLRQPR